MEEVKKLLSVIIISYEEPSLILKRAVNSVMEQSYDNTEIILVNANRKNSDYDLGLIEDMQEYPNINLISCPSEKDELAVAKNIGVEASNGEYIGFLRAKYAWNPQYAETQIKVLNEQPDVALVICNAWEEEDDVFSSDYKTLQENECSDEELIKNLNKSEFSASQIIFRRETFMELHGFDFLIRRQDEYDMWLRAYEKYKIAYVGKNLVCNYVDKSTLKKSKMIIDVVGYLQLYSKHKEIYDAYPEKKIELYSKISESYINSRHVYCWFKYMIKIKLLRITVDKFKFLHRLKK